MTPLGEIFQRTLELIFFFFFLCNTEWGQRFFQLLQGTLDTQKAYSEAERDGAEMT